MNKVFTSQRASTSAESLTRKNISVNLGMSTYPSAALIIRLGSRKLGNMIQKLGILFGKGASLVNFEFTHSSGAGISLPLILHNSNFKIARTGCFFGEFQMYTLNGLQKLAVAQPRRRKPSCQRVK